MSNSSCRFGKLAMFFPVLFIWLLVGIRARECSGQAAGPKPAQQSATAVDKHLSSGEFGPALAIAKSAKPRQRDELLQRIARAQATAGIRQAAASTAYYIGNDEMRTQTMQGIGGSNLGARSQGGRGGGSLADFSQLIDLITTTVEPDSWDDAGGNGTISEFATGVIVDTSGLMRRNSLVMDDGLEKVRTRAIRHSGNEDVRRESPMRMVSLTRLERHLQMLNAIGSPPSDVMRFLAGLQRVKYVFIYPESRDVVIAGPAGDWARNAEGRIVNSVSGRPVVQLDDLVVLLRNSFGDMTGRFSCAIVPRQENLAAAKAYLEETNGTPIKPGQRDRWLKNLRDKLGRQDIEIKGIDPRTRVAQVIAEADYHMKLIGMGLEEATVGVRSYIDSLADDPVAAKKPLNVLRWWFTLNYEAIRATPNRNAFAIQGTGAQVLSENEMINARGERIHTGQADLLTSQFAQSFTKQLDALAIKYPVYAELQNVFDLAVVAALLRAEDVPGQIDWNLPHFGQDGAYAVRVGSAPKEVESVLNHRVIRNRQIVAGVSGGVTVDPRSLVKRDAIRTDDYGLLSGALEAGQAEKIPVEKWWWD